MVAVTRANVADCEHPRTPGDGSSTIAVHASHGASACDPRRGCCRRPAAPAPAGPGCSIRRVPREPSTSSTPGWTGPRAWPGCAGWPPRCGAAPTRPPIGYVDRLRTGSADDWEAAYHDSHLVDWYRVLMADHLIPAPAVSDPRALRRGPARARAGPRPRPGAPPTAASSPAWSRPTARPRWSADIGPSSCSTAAAGWAPTTSSAPSTGCGASTPRCFRDAQPLVPLVEELYAMLAVARDRPDGCCSCWPTDGPPPYAAPHERHGGRGHHRRAARLARAELGSGPDRGRVVGAAGPGRLVRADLAGRVVRQGRQPRRGQPDQPRDRRLRRRRSAQRPGPAAGRPDHRGPRHRRAEGRGSCPTSSPAARPGASCSASRAPGPTWPGCRPRPCATATSGSSTARRCGPRAPRWPTSGMLLARTDPDVAKHAGISYFGVEPWTSPAWTSARCGR